MLSLQQTLTVVKNVKDYHAACIKNGWFVPELKSALCTREFLLQVRAQEVWVPKLEQIKLAPCPYPPPIGVIQQALVDFIDSNIASVNPPEL